MLSGAFPCAKITEGVIFSYSPNERNGKPIYSFKHTNMAFAPASRDWTVRRTPAKGSTTYTAGAFISNDGTNDVMVTAQTQQYIRGILLESKTNAASTTTSLSFQAPLSAESTFYGDVTTGTLAATDIGKAFDFDANGTGVTTTSTYKPVTLVKYISSTKGVFKLNLTTGIEN